MDSDFEEEKPQKKQRKSAAGRKLMRWNPDVDQLVLLTVDHVCVKQGIPIPWDDVARQIEPHLTGEAVKQHLAKVRNFREANGRKVPEKLDKGARRKAKLAPTADPMTPAKGGRAKKIKNEEGDDEDADTPAKGASLLWHGTPKKTKAPKSGNDATPKTPGTVRRGGGRKKAAGDGGSGDSFGDTTKSTGKRGRKKQAVKEEEGGESDYDSPTKKPKMIEKTIKLREQEEVDYTEHIDSDEDIFDAQQEDDEDDTYQETQESLPNSVVKIGFSSSQGTIIGDLPPSPPFMTPAEAAFHRGFPPFTQPNYTHTDDHSSYALQPMGQGSVNIGGLPEAYVQQLMQANNVNYNVSPTTGFGNSRGISNFPPSITSSYGGGGDYGLGMPNFNGLNDPRREQDLRDAIHKKLPTVLEEDSMDTPVTQRKQKTKTPRQKATPRAKGGPNSGTPKAKKVQNAVTAKATTAAEGNQGPMVKVENGAPSMDGDVFNDNTTGMIQIANDTGHGNYYANNFDIGYGPNDMVGVMNVKPNIYTSQAPATPTMPSLGGYGNNAFGANGFYTGVTPSVNTHTSQAPPTPMIASPDDTFGDAFDMHNAHTGVTPTLNNFNFDGSSFNSSQLTPYPSHSSSFSSINASQSVEALPSVEQGGGGMNFGLDTWNPDEYEMQLPDDDFANVGGRALGNMDFFN